MWVRFEVRDVDDDGWVGESIDDGMVKKSSKRLSFLNVRVSVCSLISECDWLVGEGKRES